MSERDGKKCMHISPYSFQVLVASQSVGSNVDIFGLNLVIISDSGSVVGGVESADSPFFLQGTGQVI